MLAIVICATKNYCYALFALAQRVAANIGQTPGLEPGSVILVGDGSEACKKAEKDFEQVLPLAWKVRVITMRLGEHTNYKADAQLTIAQMRTAGFALARRLGADQCWSLDSDVLPPANALRCMRTMLEFDGGYYGVSTCPYPSQGGSMFLGGRGAPQNPICPDVYDDEREAPKELKARMERNQERLVELKGAGDEAWQKERDAIHEALRKCPPSGNVWELNARQYRRRGWMDFAYPGIGLGAVLPSDWCGFGCTLMSSHALNLAYFDGYDGKGTEDLYIVWKRWHPNRVRLNVIPHCPCDHIVRKADGPDGVKREGYVHQAAYHERNGEMVGHLRVESRPFYQANEGEAWTETNDAVLYLPKPKEMVGAAGEGEAQEKKVEEALPEKPKE